MTKNSKDFALITGASKGLGAAFAKELAKRGFNLILVALPNEGLDDLKQTLAAFPVEVKCMETDLTVIDNIFSLTKEVNEHYALSVLINNAGIGGTCRFIDSDPNKLLKMIQLNVTALSLMTRLLLPNLMERKAYILNVSSMAAFSPIGYKTVYPASKAFVHHFSLGLSEELKDTNVSVSVINPGAMETNPEIIERIKVLGWRARLGMMTTEDVAQRSIKQMFRKDRLIVLNWVNGINKFVLRLLPRWIRLPLLSNAVKRELDIKKA